MSLSHAGCMPVGCQGVPLPVGQPEPQAATAWRTGPPRLRPPSRIMRFKATTSSLTRNFKLKALNFKFGSCQVEPGQPEPLNRGLGDFNLKFKSHSMRLGRLNHSLVSIYR